MDFPHFNIYWEDTVWQVAGLPSLGNINVPALYINKNANARLSKHTYLPNMLLNIPKPIS